MWAIGRQTIGQGCQNWHDAKTLCLLSYQCPSKHMQMDECIWMLTIFFINWKLSIKPIMMTNFWSSTFNHHNWHLKNFNHLIDSGHWSNKWKKKIIAQKNLVIAWVFQATPKKSIVNGHQIQWPKIDPRQKFDCHPKNVGYLMGYGLISIVDLVN